MDSDENLTLDEQLAQTRETAEARAEANKAQALATATAAKAQPMAALREIVLSQHQPYTQRWHEAHAALDGLEVAFAALSRLGHNFMPTLAVMAAISEWPKMMYHDGLGATVVDSSEEASKLGPGWRDTPMVPDRLPRPEWVTLVTDQAAPPIVEFDANRLTRSPEGDLVQSSSSQ
jgi:hypothetical protein